MEGVSADFIFAMMDLACNLTSVQLLLRTAVFMSEGSMPTLRMTSGLYAMPCEASTRPMRSNLSTLMVVSGTSMSFTPDISMPSRRPIFWMAPS